jgi:hypothetical protein
MGCSLLGNKGEYPYALRAKKLQAEGYVVDGLLKFGGLDCDLSGTMLQKATGMNVYGNAWDAETVAKLNKNADWDFPLDHPRDAWARESARAFLEVTATLKRGIRFSW